MKTMLRSWLGRIVLALALLWAGYGLCFLVIRHQVQQQLEEADRQVAIADSARVADSTDYELFKRTHDSLLAGQARETVRIQSLARSRGDSLRILDSLLARATTAEEQVPILTEQRDLALRDRTDLSRRVKELEQEKKDAVQAERDKANTNLAKMRRSGEARENALKKQVVDLTLKLNAPTKKLLGFLPPPTCTVGYGVQVQPATPIHASHGFQATCGAKISLHP